jgi:predicted RNA binding protein YcfA (HicA-like mRNA interferase family)
MDSREIIQKLRENGWYHVATTGSHYHFKHPQQAG